MTPIHRAGVHAVFDEAGVAGIGPVDELAMAIMDYAKRGVRLSVRKLASVFLSEEAEGSDLILFDWGGMALGNSLMEHQLRALVQYAEDHPSTLIAIRSAMCADSLRYDLEDEKLPALPNVIVDVPERAGFAPPDLPEWWLKGLKRV